MFCVNLTLFFSECILCEVFNSILRILQALKITVFDVDFPSVTYPLACRSLSCWTTNLAAAE